MTGPLSACSPGQPPSPLTADPVRLTFERAAATDFESLVALRIEAMRESLERIGRFDPARARERFRAGFAAERTLHLVVDGERVGFIATQLHPRELRLDHLYLRPVHQGRGIGAEALRSVFAQADALGLPVKVGALRESDANRFYQRHGFELLARSEFDNHCVRWPRVEADAAPPGSDVFRTLEAARTRALVERDVETIVRLHAPEYELISPGGRVLPLARYLALIEAEPFYTTWEHGPIAVRVAQGMALLRYRARLTFPSGKVVECWHTDSYERRDSGWRAVWSQATALGRDGA